MLAIVALVCTYSELDIVNTFTLKKNFRQGNIEIEDPPTLASSDHRNPVVSALDLVVASCLLTPAPLEDSPLTLQ